MDKCRHEQRAARAIANDGLLDGYWYGCWPQRLSPVVGIELIDRVRTLMHETRRDGTPVALTEVCYTQVDGVERKSPGIWLRRHVHEDNFNFDFVLRYDHYAQRVTILWCRACEDTDQ